jgi:phosphatidate cytidylyltransferase
VTDTPTEGGGVSDRGDDRGDDPQPADPWEIGSEPSDGPDSSADAGESGRGLFRRRDRGGRRGRRTARDEGSPQDDETPVFDSLADVDEGRPADPGDALIVDAPVWAGDSTAAADNIEAEGLAGAPGEPGLAEGAAGPPAAQEPLFAGEDAPADGAVASPAQDDDAGVVPPEAGDGSDDWSALMAERSPYGVSTPEAFAALSDDEHEGFDDWESFVAESASDRLLDPLESGEMTAAAEPMTRRERRQARRAAKRAERDGTADLEPGDEIPAWVEGGPEETAWLDVPDHDETPGDDVDDGAWADRPPTSEVDAPMLAGEMPDDDGPVAERDESGAEGRPIDDLEPPPTAGATPVRQGEEVWLASEQPLVHEEELSLGRHPIEAAAGEVPPPESAQEDGAWFGDETADADGYDDAEADEWVVGAVTYGDDTAPGEASPALAPPDPDDVAITEDTYAQSVTVEHLGLAEEIFRAGEDEALEWQAVSAAMPGLGTGVVGWEDVADLGAGQEEYVERAPSDLGTRVGTGVILVGLLIGAMWVGAEAFAAFVGLLVLVALGEFYTALRLRRFRPIALFGYLGGIGVLAGTWYHGPMAIAVAIVVTTVVTFFVYAFTPLGRDALSNGGLTVLGVVWITGAAAFALPLVQADEFRPLVLTVVALTVAMDVGAFGVGRMWGSRALAPALSPNKTMEGLFGGIAVTVAAAFGAAALFEGITTSFALWLAAIVIVLAPVGDLAESMVKRSLQLKDMGTILPGHGGVLDRIDAFLFILPGAWALSKVLGLIG